MKPKSEKNNELSGNLLSLEAEEQKQHLGQVDDKSPRTLQSVKANEINNFSECAPFMEEPKDSPEPALQSNVHLYIP